MKFSVNDFVALDLNGLFATNGGSSGSCSSYSSTSSNGSGYGITSAIQSTVSGQGYSVTSSHNTSKTNVRVGSCSSYSGGYNKSTKYAVPNIQTSREEERPYVTTRTGSCSGTQNGEALLGSPKFMCNFPGNTANHDGVIVGTAPIATYQNQNVVLFADKLTA